MRQGFPSASYLSLSLLLVLEFLLLSLHHGSGGSLLGALLVRRQPRARPKGLLRGVPLLACLES